MDELSKALYQFYPASGGMNRESSGRTTTRGSKAPYVEERRTKGSDMMLVQT
jgi:hypothetical protein